MPCVKCLAAAYWAGIAQIYYGNTREDAKRIGFDDSLIYEQIPIAPQLRTIPSQQLLREEAIATFDAWDEKLDKVIY